jgi:glycosyltransferase involved in cell wall biosynthesis
MAIGTPVVATTAGAIPEVLGEAARLVPPGDADALAGALQAVLDDGTVRDRLATAGREQARLYSWDAAADGVAALYRRLC